MGNKICCIAVNDDDYNQGFRRNKSKTLMKANLINMGNRNASIDYVESNDTYKDRSRKMSTLRINASTDSEIPLTNSVTNSRILDLRTEISMKMGN